MILGWNGARLAWCWAGMALGSRLESGMVRLEWLSAGMALGWNGTRLEWHSARMALGSNDARKGMLAGMALGSNGARLWRSARMALGSNGAGWNGAWLELHWLELCLAGIALSWNGA